jgi:hypothetical protein
LVFEFVDIINLGNAPKNEYLASLLNVLLSNKKEYGKFFNLSYMLTGVCESAEKDLTNNFDIKHSSRLI